ncbi:hypothetical protein TERMP_01629 [Thermococcus barophilus MP]|uniref:Uncharacterized protein n=1 Tax=Thermococcus barophilus (strain DSM 11836 / MP) TaxID=391623 RepID=F0LJ82_THEBM|nr:hypothetical protein TERMP_01629 [Thermococcus barophilus MP]
MRIKPELKTYRVWTLREPKSLRAFLWKENQGLRVIATLNITAKIIGKRNPDMAPISKRFSDFTFIPDT